MSLLKLKFIIPFAILAALLATLGAHSYLQNQKAALEKDHKAVRQVMVARIYLPAGSKLDNTVLEVKKFPAELAPPGSFARDSELIDRVTKSELFAGEVVLESRMAALGSGGGFSAAIPAGMRAMTVAVNVVSGVSGFILPHARVDVLATVSASSDKQESTTTTILENVEVLAVDQTVSPKDDEPITVKSVTLLVTPPQAEKLALASYEGKLLLALRNTADQVEAAPTGVRLKELINKSQPVPEPQKWGHAVAQPQQSPVVVKEEPAKESPRQVIEVYRSNSRSEVVLDDGRATEVKPKN